MDIAKLMKYGKYYRMSMSFDSNTILGSNETMNIKIIESIYDEIKSSMNLDELIFFFEPMDICINFKTCVIRCEQTLIKYIANIIKKDSLFFWIHTRSHYNNDYNVISSLSVPHICASNVFFSQENIINLNWKNTYIRHFDCYDILGNDSLFIQWLKTNNQVISLDTLHIHGTMLLKFIKENPNHSLQYFYSTGRNFNNHNELQNVLKNKRKNIHNQILTLLLIANSQHKYKKYLPKPIIKYMLFFMYDIEYMKNHHKIAKYYAKN